MEPVSSTVELWACPAPSYMPGHFVAELRRDVLELVFPMHCGVSYLVVLV